MEGKWMCTHTHTTHFCMQAVRGWGSEPFSKIPQNTGGLWYIWENWQEQQKVRKWLEATLMPLHLERGYCLVRLESITSANSSTSINFQAGIPICCQNEISLTAVWWETLSKWTNSTKQEICRDGSREGTTQQAPASLQKDSRGFTSH